MVLGQRKIIYKLWFVNFGPLKELVDTTRAWDIFTRLPLVFLGEFILKAIKNKMGIFVGLEPSLSSNPDHQWALIEVENCLR